MTDVSTLSAVELEKLLKQKKQEELEQERQRKLDYQTIKEDTATELQATLCKLMKATTEAYHNIQQTAYAHRELMKEYGQLKSDEQLNYNLISGNFKFECKAQKIKGFDETATVASTRLMQFLDKYLLGYNGDVNSPNYLLIKKLAQGRRDGSFDYKNLSVFYELETNFADPEYSDIMKLFRNSNIEKDTAMRYYFYTREHEHAEWERIEPSFNRFK